MASKEDLAPLGADENRSRSEPQGLGRPLNFGPMLPKRPSGLARSSAVRMTSQGDLKATAVGETEERLMANASCNPVLPARQAMVATIASKQGSMKRDTTAKAPLGMAGAQLRPSGELPSHSTGAGSFKTPLESKEEPRARGGSNQASAPSSANAQEPGVEPNNRGHDEAGDGRIAAAFDGNTTRLRVSCNGNDGIFVVDRHVIVCLCAQCKGKAAEMGQLEIELSPTDFERHSGSYTSKKWKYTVKVLEQTPDGDLVPGISVGSWLEKHVPTMAAGRARALGYSSIFGDVAPMQMAMLPKKPGSASRRKRRPRRGPSAGGQPGETEDAAGFGQPDGMEGPTPSPEPGSREETDSPARLKQEAPDGPVVGVTAADLTSPSGKKWLSAASSRTEIRLPTPEMREGSQFQAQLPAYRGSHPNGGEQDERMAGIPGRSGLDALVWAATYEKQASDVMHIDAVADPEYHPGAVERGQRTRRKPKWLSNTVEHGAGPGGKLPLVETAAGEEDSEEGDAPLSWRRPAKRKLTLEFGHSARDEQRKAKLTFPPPGRGNRGGASHEDSSLPPQVLQWQVLNDGFMRITVAHKGQRFTGALMPQPGASHMAEEPLAYNKSGLSVTSHEDQMVSESEGWDASRAQADSRPSWNHGFVDGPVDVAADGGMTPTSDNYEDDSFRGPHTAMQPKTTHKRRVLADRDYERMQAEGPKHDSTCALCHLPADPEAKGACRAEDPGDDVDFNVLERREEGLGPFLLVKVSAISNAWVHMQCALWSPEVYVNINGGVKKADEMVRRGRMIKCKLCGEKGATLGCHKKSCRASFHLTCARQHNCLLQGIGSEDYLVTCREHANISNEMELVPLMPVMPDQKRRSSPHLSDVIPKRPRNSRPDTKRLESASPTPTREERTATRKTGWNTLPKMTASLDTLSAAALAARNANVESAANPLAAQHFGGTVGQSVLRPGRCAVCVVQRKGVCGTSTAPKKCLRRVAIMAAGREVPDPPASWRTRRPLAQWPATPLSRSERAQSLSQGAEVDKRINDFDAMNGQAPEDSIPDSSDM